MVPRAVTPELGEELRAAVAKAARYYATLGYGSFAAGNADGGLTTIEEKSLGAYMPSRALANRRPDQAGRPAAARRALPDGRGARRRGALRLSQHLRQCRDRRDDGLGRAPDAVRHRARLGGRLGARAGHQDRRQSRHVRAAGRGHGRQCRPHHSGRSLVDQVGEEIYELVLDVAAGRDQRRRRWAMPNSS
jgi:hypothetical protein